MKTLIVGHGGREAALAWKMAENSELYAYMAHANPSIIGAVKAANGEWEVGDVLNPKAIKAFADGHEIDLAVVSSDEPLAAGVIDALKELGIKTVGPTKFGAQIEWDKDFSRRLVEAICPEYNPEFYIAHNPNEALEVIKNFGEREYAIKPSGLTGGKGVKVVGVNISKDDAPAYALELLDLGHGAVIFEEKLEGIEFTVQAITDGKTIIFPPATYDYPYRFDGDQGPGTGGMGVYTGVSPCLPFMTERNLAEAKEIIQKIIKGLDDEKRDFNGVLNAGFFALRDGSIKIIEFNARFGDPECMNIMMLLEDDCNLVKALAKIASQTLEQEDISFKKQASVVAYMVAPEYGQKVTESTPCIFKVDASGISSMGCKVFFASAVQAEGVDEYKTVGTSRSVAIGATGNSIAVAHSLTMEAISRFTYGGLEYRKEIGQDNYITSTVNFLKGNDI